MSETARNSSYSESDVLRRVKPRYIVLYENIILKLSPETLKLYMILRLEADYSQECSSVKRTIKFFMNKSGLSRTQSFESLRELEEFGLVTRESNPGFQSIYWVAQDLDYFTEKDESPPDPHSLKIDIPVQDMDYSNDPVQNTDYPVQDTDTISINRSNNKNKTIKPLVDFKKSTDYKDDNLFMRFYKIYPNKQKPVLARKSFYKLKPTESFVDMLCQDVLMRTENNWKGRHKNKIPHPSTYLNAKEWEGEIYQAESTKTQAKDSFSQFMSSQRQKIGNVFDEHGHAFNQ